MRSLLPIVFMLTFLVGCVEKEEKITFISEYGHKCVHYYHKGNYTKEYCSHDSDRRAIKHQDSIIKIQRVMINEIFKYVEKRESANIAHK